MFRPLLAAVLAALLAAAALAAASQKSKPAAPTNSCTTCLERRPTLDPLLFPKGPDPAVRRGYEIARQYPATLDRIHCFCECQESPAFRHKTLLTCFVDRHAAGCGICLREAELAARLKEKGLSDAEIERTVESVNRTDGHASTADHRP